MVLRSPWEDKPWTRHHKKVRQFLSINRLWTSLGPWFKTLKPPKIFPALQEIPIKLSAQMKKPNKIKQIASTAQENSQDPLRLMRWTNPVFLTNNCHHLSPANKVSRMRKWSKKELHLSKRPRDTLKQAKVSSSQIQASAMRNSRQMVVVIKWTQDENWPVIASFFTGITPLWTSES